MIKNFSGYYVNNHSCFLLQYHLVLVTKYRHAVLVDEVEATLITYTKEYFESHECVILEINSSKDHIHILFEAPPQINLAGFVNAYKSASSRKMRNLHASFLNKYYWKPYFWSTSYFLCTVSERTADAVSNYIKNQKL